MQGEFEAIRRAHQLQDPPPAVNTFPTPNLSERRKASMLPELRQCESATQEKMPPFVADGQPNNAFIMATNDWASAQAASPEANKFLPAALTPDIEAFKIAKDAVQQVGEEEEEDSEADAEIPDEVLETDGGESKQITLSSFVIATTGGEGMQQQ